MKKNRSTMEMLNQIKQIAINMDGECLSDTWLGNNIKHKFKCNKDGYEWDAQPGNIKGGKWCPRCSGRVNPNALSEIQQIVQIKNGECLSSKYNCKEMLFRCSCGNEWTTAPGHVRNGKWCRNCSAKRAGKNNRLKKDQLNSRMLDLIAHANKKGGKVISEEYDTKKMTFQCGKGHKWEASPNNFVKRDRWCKACYLAKMSIIGINTLDDNQRSIRMVELINKTKENGGSVVSECFNVKKMTFRCEANHEWSAPPGEIMRGRWCQKCYYMRCGQTLRLTENDLLVLAGSMGLKLITPYSNYKGSNCNVEWKCENGHHFHASPGNVRAKRGCPHCRSFIGEQICRQAFELIFNKSFPKVRPDWLINPETNSKMELDGFCIDMQLAFEYQGSYFHSRPKTLHRDQIKRDVCVKNNIKLIAVPEFISYTNYKSAMVEVVKILHMENILVNHPDVDFNPKFVRSPQLKLIHDLVSKNGGTTDVIAYLAYNSKFEVKCNKNHFFKTSAVLLKMGCWCPFCAKVKIANPMDELIKIAREQGGELIGCEYKNNRSKLRFRCGRGHEWDAVAAHIKNSKSWCPHCANERRKLLVDRLGPLLEIRQIAKDRGGECLSFEYENNQKKLRFRCGDGHEWDAASGHIKHAKSWCPICRRKQAAKTRCKIKK